ncbi:hypothetical protein ACFV16_40220 [Streptomyces massasporeus]|uniref:hypothetical protein n=1 Tax=Streptomyces massasporeus TaxID=67324 RepID=UPI00368A0F0F
MGTATVIMNVCEDGELSSLRCFTAGDVTLAQLVDVICRRWRIEETFQLGRHADARPGGGAR